MSVLVEGQLYLTQDKEVVKHINLELVSNFINKLSQTRRVARNFYSSKCRKLNDKHLKFDKDAYGNDGKWYYKDDYEESIEHINDKGVNPSLILPFYVEKENDKYVLKCEELPNGNNLKSIQEWLDILDDKIFLMSGIVPEGQFIFSDDENKVRKKIKYKDNKIYKSNKNQSTLAFYGDRKEIIDMINNGTIDKEDYFPEIFDYISKEIEAGNLPLDYDFSE